MVETDPQKIQELLTRGVAEVVVAADLETKLKSGKPLRIKLGIDPTSHHIHLGRAVHLLKLRDFQELGHKIVLIVGDFTGVIGDTSDKDSERPMLSDDQIAQNQQTYFEQMGKIIDLDQVEKHYNSEWLGKLTYKEISRQANVFSVADFIARDNIARRLEAGSRVSLREMLYPLMQGYDSVAVQADVEIGGMDQKFNLLAGRKLQEQFDQTPQNLILSPLIAGLDGRKMSSSWGNTVNVHDEPSEMYGKLMSLRDDQVIEYFTLCTRLPLADITTLAEGLKANTVHPKEAKMQLAREIVTLYHDSKSAAAAEQQYVQTFSEGAIPADLVAVSVSANATLRDVLIEQQLVASGNEFHRLIAEGAVHNLTTNETVTDTKQTIPPGETVFKIGKRRFVKTVIT